MRLAVTADLHFGMGSRGAEPTRALARRVAELEPDVFMIAGDVGEGDQFGRCLDLFDQLPCIRLLVPGNHDLWLKQPSHGASFMLYENRLPAVSESHGFQYLDRQPYLADRGGEALLGSINWYDYSFADPDLEREFPNVHAMYARKLFPSGWHNDGRFVRLGMPDEEFTTRLVDRFRHHLASLPAEIESVTVIQHHPPVRELFYPSALTTLEQRFWLAYTGNRRMQEAVVEDTRVKSIICGHTHAACDVTVEGKRCINVGGDYDWKRLVLLDTTTGEHHAWEFR